MEKEEIIKYNLQKQFRREVEIQTSLNHPNLTKSYGYFHDEKRVVFLSFRNLVQGRRRHSRKSRTQKLTGRTNGRGLCQKDLSFILQSLPKEPVNATPTGKKDSTTSHWKRKSLLCWSESITIRKQLPPPKQSCPAETLKRICVK